MSGNVVNLNELVPGLEGKTFTITRADGTEESYHVPGDLDSKTVFEFLGLFEKMVEFQEEANRLQAEVNEDPTKEKEALTATLKGMQDLNDDMKARLLVVFQKSNPDLKELPFGSQTTMVVLGHVLEMMGLSEQEGLPGPPQGEELPPPNRAARRAGSRPTTTRSTKKAGARSSQGARKR